MIGVKIHGFVGYLCILYAIDNAIRPITLDLSRVFYQYAALYQV